MISAESTHTISPRISYLFQTNQGSVATRNAGLVQAQSNVTALCNVDDLRPATDELATQLPTLAVHPTTAVVLGCTQGAHSTSGVQYGQPHDTNK